MKYCLLAIAPLFGCHSQSEPSTPLPPFPRRDVQWQHRQQWRVRSNAVNELLTWNFQPIGPDTGLSHVYQQREFATAQQEAIDRLFCEMDSIRENHLQP